MVIYPGDWEVKKLEERCVILDNKRKPVSSSVRVAGKYPYYGANGILDYVSSYIFDGTYVLVGEDGSVITPNGNPVVTWAEGKIWVNNHAHVIAEKEGTSLRYLFYYLQTINISELIHGNIPKLTGHDLRNLLIPLPTLKEQTAIAETLAAFDTHITNLTELITKKKAIRDGALDELMTGRTRLYGFCGDWEVKTLGECVTILQGGTPSTSNPLYWGGDIVWVTPSEITKLHSMYISDSERKITHAGLVNSSATIVPAGTILLCSRATIGELAIATRPMTTNQGFKNLICGENINNVFLAYLLLTLKKVMITLSRGTTFLELSKNSLQSIKISLPPLDEQIAIADTLSALDKEISSLETERAKISSIRDGAINDLLTGKVRLKK